MRAIRIAVSLATILQFSLIAGPLWADWVQDGTGSLNISPGQNANGALVAISNGTPYVCWYESNGTATQIYVKHLNNNTWVQDGSTSLNISPGQNAVPCSLAFYNGTPYVSWQETNGTATQVYVKHFNSSTWVLDGRFSLNMDPTKNATGPSLAFYNGTPYVSWSESNGTASQIYVKYLSGINWDQLGNTSLNMDTTKNAGSPSLAFYNSTPYVSWSEGSPNQIYVKHFNGSSWVQDGTTSLNMVPGNNALVPRLALSNGTPYVSWFESSGTGYQIFVKHFTGSNWVQDGNTNLNINTGDIAVDPNLDIYNGTPYVTWYELIPVTAKNLIYQVYVKHLSGNTWIQDGVTNLNMNTGQNAYNPSLALSNGTPYVSWDETSGTTTQIFVKHFSVQVASVTPSFKVIPQPSVITITGNGFETDSTAKLTRPGSADILSTGIKQISNLSIAFNFDFTGTTPNAYDLQVSAGTVQGGLKQAFTILSAAQVPLVWSCTDLGVNLAAGSMSGAACGLAIGDADQDNSQELYVANETAGLFQIKRQFNGWSKNSVPAGGVGGANFNGVLLADGNGDQAWELYGASANDHAYEFKTASWQMADLADPAGTGSLYGLAALDADHDGIVEIYASRGDGHVLQIKRSGTGGISDITPAGFSGGQGYALASGDGNNDGILKLYSANSDHKIYQYTYNGAWQAAALGTATNIMYSVAVGDGDNDGKNEVYGGCGDCCVYQCRWNGTSWSMQPIGTHGGDVIYSVAVSDAENCGSNQVYAACGDGHVYEYKCQAGNWATSDLGNAGTPLYALVVGDADNDHHFEVYALGQNNHVYQFKAGPTATATPTPSLTPTTITVAPIPQSYFKVFHSQINPLHSEQARIRWTQPQAGPVSIEIYNLLGDKVITLQAGGNFTSGEYHEVDWNGRTQKGAVAGSGIYIVCLQAGGTKTWAKVAVVK